MKCTKNIKSNVSTEREHTRKLSVMTKETLEIDFFAPTVFSQLLQTPNVVICDFSTKVYAIFADYVMKLAVF